MKFTDEPEYEVKLPPTYMFPLESNSKALCIDVRAGNPPPCINVVSLVPSGFILTILFTTPAVEPEYTVNNPVTSIF